MATAKQTRRAAANGASGATGATVPIAPPAEEQLAQLPDQMPGGEQVGAETEERRERELEEILTELGNDSRIRVYHVIDGRSMFAGELSVEGFTLDVLLDNYGGGEKTLKIYQGRNLVSTQRVPLDPTIPPTSPRQKRAEAEKAMRPGGGGLGDMASLISAMGTAQLAQVSNTQAMLQMMQKQSADAMAMQQQQQSLMITALTGMFQALKPAAPAPTADPLEMLKAAAEIMRPKDGAAAGITEMLSIFDKGMRVGQAVGGKDDEGDSVMPIVREGVKGLVSIAESVALSKRIEAERAAGGRPVTQVAAAPVPVYLPTPGEPPGMIAGAYQPPSPGLGERQPVEPKPEPEAKVAGTIMPTNERSWLIRARAFKLEDLLTSPWATKMPADAAAATILSNLSDDELNDLMDDIYDETPPNFGGRLVVYFPALAQLSQPALEWLESVVKEIIAQTQPEGADEDESIEAGEPQELIDAARKARREKPADK